LNAALVVMARYPRLGRVKTRLARDLGDAAALAIYEACAAHTLAAARAVDVARWVALSDPADLADAAAWAEGFRLVAQALGDLGARMRAAVLHAQAQGASGVILLGTDVPDVTPALLQQAVALLADHDAVLGPAHDGGYWLLGVRTPHPALFEDIPWSTPAVAAITRGRLAALGARVAELPALGDLDTEADLRAWAAPVDHPVWVAAAPWVHVGGGRA
jgi:rSAM/selenodomain-associated transferase 1